MKRIRSSFHDENSFISERIVRSNGTIQYVSYNKEGHLIASGWTTHTNRHSHPGPKDMPLNSRKRNASPMRTEQVHRDYGLPIFENYTYPHFSFYSSQRLFLNNYHHSPHMRLPGEIERLEETVTFTSNHTLKYFLHKPSRNPFVSKVLHRVNKPAVTLPNGTEQYWHENQLHRSEDAPAVIYPDGSVEYWVRGRLHREGAPAVLLSDGTQVWFRHGLKHRDGGPAVIEANGVERWYRNDRLHRDNDKPAVVFPDGTQVWFKNGLIHRDNDKPAIVHANSTHAYYVEGVLHRDGGPAVSSPQGLQAWFANGKLHSLTGPALVMPGQDKGEYFIRGRRCRSEQRWGSKKSFEEIKMLAA